MSNISEQICIQFLYECKRIYITILKTSESDGKIKSDCQKIESFFVLLKVAKPFQF